MIFPISDENPTRHTAWMTGILIGLNLLVFFYQIQGPGLDRSALEWGFIPAELTLERGTPVQVSVRVNPFQIKRIELYRPLPASLTLLTSLFLHGGYLHVLGNMLFLWIFGNNIEDFLGPWRFLVFYLLGGVAGSLAHFLFNIGSVIPLVGASGAISAVMGAYLVLFPQARIRSLVFIFILVTFVHIPAKVFLLIWFFMQFFASEGVAWMAHVGGFLFGYLMMRAIKKTHAGGYE